MQTGGPLTWASSTTEAPDADDQRTIAALLAGDEPTFAALIQRYNATMLRLAMVYMADRAVAEEVVQDTWVAVLQGLPRFEGRAALRTWIFRILTNQAQTRGQREARLVPFSALGPGAEEGTAEPAVDRARFRSADDPRGPQHWAVPPQSWDEVPEQRLLALETRVYIRQAIDTLAPRQRAVIILRDVQGWSSEEVCNVLGIAETNQRVLLHRARAKVRRALEQYFAGDQAS